MKRFQFDWLLWNLQTVDMQELVDHGGIQDRDYAAWDAFCEDRMGWYLRASPNAADSVYKALLKHKMGKQHPKDPPPPANVIPLPRKREP